MKRILTALVVGALATLLPLVVFLLSENSDFGWLVLLMAIAAPSIIMGFFFFLLLVMLPIHLVLVDKGWVHAWVYVLVGVIGGLIIVVCIDLFTGGWSGWAEYAYFGVFGCVATVTFWWVLRFRQRL